MLLTVAALDACLVPGPLQYSVHILVKNGAVTAGTTAHVEVAVVVVGDYGWLDDQVVGIAVGHG